MSKLFVTLIAIIPSYPSFGASQSMENKNIIFYCENKAETPWVYNAPANCRGSFNPAVLGLLLYIDNNSNLQPSSIETFDWDIKNNYYKLKLKDNLFFQNGRKVTSKDLEFSIVRFFFAKTPNIAATFMSNLKGTEKIKHGQPYKTGLVDGIKILDERTIAITSSKPNPSFLYTLALADFALVPQEELENDLLTWKKWPVGSGAYQIDSFDKENRTYLLKLVKEKEYPNAPKTILFEQSRIFEPDLSLKDSISAEDKKFRKEKMLAPFFIRIFNFNFSSKLGSNNDFRKAVSLALSKEDISNATKIATTPLYETTPPGGIGRINAVENQNISEAKKLFKKALGEHYNNKIFKVPYTPDDSYLGLEYKEVIRKQLAVAGLQIEFFEIVNLWDPFTGKFKDSPMYLCSQGSDFFDPLVAFSKYRKGSPAKDRYPNDDLLEQLIERAKEAPSRDNQHERLKDLSNYFNENNVISPLFVVPTTAYYKPEKISSIGNQFGGMTFYLDNIIVNKKEKK